jgi:hypothetical protein
MATITTPRLSLTPFEPSDWPFFRALTFQVINFVDNKILECFTLQVFPLG